MFQFRIPWKGRRDRIWSTDLAHLWEAVNPYMLGTFGVDVAVDVPVQLPLFSNFSTNYYLPSLSRLGSSLTG